MVIFEHDQLTCLPRPNQNGHGTEFPASGAGWCEDHHTKVEVCSCYTSQGISILEWKFKQHAIWFLFSCPITVLRKSDLLQQHKTNLNCYLLHPSSARVLHSAPSQTSQQILWCSQWWVHVWPLHLALIVLDIHLSTLLQNPEIVAFARQFSKQSSNSSREGRGSGYQRTESRQSTSSGSHRMSGQK